MGLLLGRVFSTTIKYSQHFHKDGDMLTCDCKENFLNLFKNHMAMFILVI